MTQLIIGNKYNWKGQQERLVYLGFILRGRSKWHQFAKVDAPSVVWCEVTTSYLKRFGATK